jgi:hypothetical protein
MVARTFSSLELQLQLLNSFCSEQMDDAFLVLANVTNKLISALLARSGSLTLFVLTNISFHHHQCINMSRRGTSGDLKLVIANRLLIRPVRPSFSSFGSSNCSAPPRFWWLYCGDVARGQNFPFHLPPSMPFVIAMTKPSFRIVEGQIQAE